MVLVRRSRLYDMGPFEVLEKVDENAYRFGLPPYMHIYSIVNVEN